MNMLSYRSLLSTFRSLELGDVPVIAHASLSAFGRIKGGAETMVGALLASFQGVMMPTFTYRTMITPEVGPPDNAITYGSGSENNKNAEFFRLNMPTDNLMGSVAETLRTQLDARRTSHPIYSFSGVKVDWALKTQTIENPFGPIQALTEAGGWVILIGADHTVNTSIHYGEQVAGRRQFIRWALTPQGIVPCPRWPGCSYGFNQVAPMMETVTRTIEVGMASVFAVPLKELIAVVREMIIEDPFALLCNEINCERCAEIRRFHTPQLK